MIAIPIKQKEDGALKSAKLFGRSDCFAIVADDGAISYLDNNFASGVELSNKLIDLGVKVLITNHLGKKAYSILKSAQIEIFYSNKNMSIEELISLYKLGSLKEFDESMTRTPLGKTYAKSCCPN